MKSVPAVATLLLITSYSLTLGQDTANPELQKNPVEAQLPQLGQPSDPYSSDPNTKKSNINSKTPQAPIDVAQDWNPSRPGRDTLQLKIFALQHIRATDAERTISQLYGEELESASVDNRSNSLLIRSNPTQLAEIEAVLLRLDSAEAANLPAGLQPVPGTARQPGVQQGYSYPAGSIGRAGTPIGLPGARNPSGYPGGATGNQEGTTGITNTSSGPSTGIGEVQMPKSVETLRARYQSLDAQCLKIAERLRQLRADRSRRSGNSNPLDTLTSELASAVKDAFRARQDLQRAELAAFQARMQQIEQSIRMRDRIANQIVGRRVEDLLNPNLSWENASVTKTDRLRESDDPGQGLSFAEEVEADVARVEQEQAELQGKWVLSRSADDETPWTIIVDGNRWQFFDAELKQVQTATVSRKAPRLVAEFGEFPRSTWMGKFELAGGRLTLQFTAANAIGPHDPATSGANLEASLRNWSGVYHKANKAAEIISPEDATISPITRVYVSAQPKTELQGRDELKVHASLMTSNVVLEAAIKDNNLQELPLCNSRDDLAQWLRDNVIVRSVEDGALEVGLSGEPSDRAQLIKIVVALKSAYEEFIDEHHQDAAAEVTNILKEQSKELEEQLFKRESEYTKLKSSGKVPTAELETLKQELEKRNTLLRAIRQQLESIEVKKRPVDSSGR